MQTHCRFHHQVFNGPATQLDDAGLTADGSSQGDGLGVSDAVGACDGDQFRFGINRAPGQDFRCPLADFVRVERGSNGIDFKKPQCRGGRNHAGVKMLAGQVDDAIGHGVDGLRDKGNFPVTNEHVSLIQIAAGDGVDRGSFE